MSHTIKLKKGFDIHLAGKAEKKVVEIQQPETFALKPTDFKALSRPRVLVKEGDKVKAGTPLMLDKLMEEVLYTSPVSGEVAEIKRGEKRKLLEIKIHADTSTDYVAFQKYSISDIANLSREAAQKQMTESGVWPMIIQRPFGIVANPADSPRAIFISAFDSHPLAPDVALLLEGQEAAFQAGLNILKKFTSGHIYLSLDGRSEVPQVFAHAQGVQINTFNGPHPAGNVGTQIHHISPINKGEIVWTVDAVGVAQIGKLFLEGKYDASRVVAITGSEVKQPHYVKTIAGAMVNKMLEGQLTEKANVRVISGNVLTGEKIGGEGFLGFYHHQVTVIPEGDKEEFMGWILPSTKKLSFHKAFGLLSFLSPTRERVLDTNTHGEERGFVVTGSFEKVVPMDILPTYLFKSIIANDFDSMENLGIYELIEEDVALCEFIDVSKNHLQELLREGIDLIRHS
ncbi:MAG: Na(+)-translocating NADH-quinone reductase subunit A [Cyclobacteriaceae bacterium]|nr:Na(+)-translocating NADH-quinone reductase subunit A [Cyclobacteriaceae bacterium]